MTLPLAFLRATHDARLSAMDLRVLADVWATRDGSAEWLPIHAWQVARRLAAEDASRDLAVVENTVRRAVGRLVAFGHLERAAVAAPERRALRRYRLVPPGEAPPASGEDTAAA